MDTVWPTCLAHLQPGTTLCHKLVGSLTLSKGCRDASFCNVCPAAHSTGWLGAACLPARATGKAVLRITGQQQRTQAGTHCPLSAPLERSPYPELPWYPLYDTSPPESTGPGKSRSGQVSCSTPRPETQTARATITCDGTGEGTKVTEKRTLGTKANNRTRSFRLASNPRF